MESFADWTADILGVPTAAVGGAHGLKLVKLSRVASRRVAVVGLIGVVAWGQSVYYGHRADAEEELVGRREIGTEWVTQRVLSSEVESEERVETTIRYAVQCPRMPEHAVGLEEDDANEGSADVVTEDDGTSYLVIRRPSDSRDLVPAGEAWSPRTDSVLSEADR